MRGRHPGNVSPPRGRSGGRVKYAMDSARLLRKAIQRGKADGHAGVIYRILRFGLVRRESQRLHCSFCHRGTDRLPSELKESKPLWERQAHFFSALLDVTEAAICEENLPSFRNSRKGEEYLESFSSCARKGIFSYDMDFDDLVYKLIVSSENPTRLADLTSGFDNNLAIIDHNYNCSSVIRI